MVASCYFSFSSFSHSDNQKTSFHLLEASFLVLYFYFANDKFAITDSVVFGSDSFCPFKKLFSSILYLYFTIHSTRFYFRSFVKIKWTLSTLHHYIECMYRLQVHHNLNYY